MSEQSKPKIAWCLHHAGSIYYTDEQMVANYPELKKFYIEFIERSAYDALLARNAELEKSLNFAVGGQYNEIPLLKLELESLRAQLAEREGHMLALEETFNTNCEVVDNLRAQLAEKDAVIADLKECSNNKFDEIQKLKAQLAEAQAECLGLKEASERHTSLQQQMSRHADSLSAQLTAANRRADIWIETCDQQRTVIEQLEAELKSANEKLAEVQQGPQWRLDEVQAVLEELKAANEKVSELERDRDYFKVCAEGLIDSCDKLEDETVAQKVVVADLARLMNEAIDENKILREALEKYKAAKAFIYCDPDDIYREVYVAEEALELARTNKLPGGET